MFSGAVDSRACNFDSFASDRALNLYLSFSICKEASNCTLSIQLSRSSAKTISIARCVRSLSKNSAKNSYENISGFVYSRRRAVVRVVRTRPQVPFKSVGSSRTVRVLSFGALGRFGVLFLEESTSTFIRSVGRSGRSVGRSIGRSVGRSVGRSPWLVTRYGRNLRGSAHLGFPEFARHRSALVPQRSIHPERTNRIERR